MTAKNILDAVYEVRETWNDCGMSDDEAVKRIQKILKKILKKILNMKRADSE